MRSRDPIKNQFIIYELILITKLYLNSIVLISFIYGFFAQSEKRQDKIMEKHIINNQLLLIEANFIEDKLFKIESKDLIKDRFIIYELSINSYNKTSFPLYSIQWKMKSIYKYIDTNINTMIAHSWLKILVNFTKMILYMEIG